jgi:adenine-specific DNA-methyltransferase
MIKEPTSRKNGVVYTPEILSAYVAAKTLQYFRADRDYESSARVSIVDPACGDGKLLSSVSKLFPVRDGDRRLTVCGVDIDDKALKSCERNLAFLGKTVDLVLISANALNPTIARSLSSLHVDARGGGWNPILAKASVRQGFDILIANPPWGADISDYKDDLDPNQYRSLRGQFDSFELFVELALRIVKPGGYFSFIIPDSILNHGKSAIRNLLVSSTEIKFIARLGEKIFPKVNRGCVVIICKNSPAPNASLVDCFRLPSKERSLILSGRLSFSQAEAVYVHQVPQRRFVGNRQKQFDIDVRESETALLSKLRSGSGTLADALSCTRGVELGSSGEIMRCDNCSAWAPLSEKDSFTCPNCGNKYNPGNAQRERMTAEKRVSGSVPFITGSDLKRYSGVASKWIILGKKGINYKPMSIYDPPKILIRKTGVGLTASLDYTPALTNQVVYILRKKSDSEPDLEFFIGLINSRAYYFYLVKSFGELEWKSHPYLIQSQILGLPLPDLSSEGSRKIIAKIVSVLRPSLKKGRPSKQVDLEVELLIGKLFSLTPEDYTIMFNAINELDELLPVRELKGIDLREVLERTK